MPSWVVERLGPQHDRASFSCGNDSLDRYLKEIASQDARRLVAAPFILIEVASPNKISGYYTLSAFSIAPGELPSDVARKLPSYPVVGATLLGRLAVDKTLQGQGLGEFLLLDALHRARNQTSDVASVAVIVDAIDEHAIKFYRHFDFIPFPERPDRLFLPMATIDRL